MQTAFRKLVRSLLGFFITYILVLVVVFIWIFNARHPSPVRYEPVTVFDTPIAASVNSTTDPNIQLGYELMVRTSLTIGPLVADTAMRFSGNRLECVSCHLNEGAKAYGIPLNTVVNRFPQYRAREDKMGTLEERINGCLTRSMNGRPMKTNQKEMKAFVAYLDWMAGFKDGNLTLAKDNEMGLLDFSWPNRKADLANGAEVYKKQCVSCHGNEGGGILDPLSGQYMYPPLWGADSYNNGAGMNRLITAAQFIKYNMPFGVSYRAPILTDTEAYDVAAFINQQQRPIKTDLALDFPNKLKKPLSTPYGPYADEFSSEQHKLGPFQPMVAFYKTRYGMVKNK